MTGRPKGPGSDDPLETPEDRARCWCGAFATHTPEGIECEKCGDLAPTAGLDLEPSGYEYDEDAGRWVHPFDQEGDA